jgi:hypothetical protein
MTPTEEWGRELLANELLEKTVVILRREDRDIAMTAWVYMVSDLGVIFKQGVSRTMFLCARRSDGTLCDDTMQRVHVYEFLGEVDGQTQTKQ